MAALIAGSALRMSATVSSAHASAAHACTLHAGTSEEGAHAEETRAEVRIRVRNCGARSASLCLECGELGGRATPLSATVRSATAAEGSPASRHMVLSAHARYQWLGGARRHVMDLPAQAEQECSAQLVLSGHGAFVVDGIVCTWNVPEASILGRVLQGDKFEVFVEEAVVS